MSSNGVAESAFRFYTMSNPCGDVVGSVGLLAGSLKLASSSVAWIVARRGTVALVVVPVPAITGQLNESFQGFENLRSCFLFRENALTNRRPDRYLAVGARVVEIEPARWPVMESMNLLAELVYIDLPAAPPGKVRLEGAELASQFAVVRPASKLAQ